MSREAMKLALEALEESLGYVEEEAENAQRIYGQYPTRQARIQGLKDDVRKHMKAIAALREALAEQPAQSTAEKSELETVPANGGLLPAQQALDKMAENARELGLDYEPAQEKDQSVMYTYPSKPEPIPCGKPIGILMKQKGDKHMKLYPLAEQPAQQEPVDFASLLREAEEIVREKPTWKRFIDGTPLSNDVPVWMTVFAQDVARRASPTAIKPLTDEQPQRWAVFCGICRKVWSVPYQHPGKSVCNDCKAAYGIKGEA